MRELRYFGINIAAHFEKLFIIPPVFASLAALLCFHLTAVAGLMIHTITKYSSSVLVVSLEKLTMMSR